MQRRMKEVASEFSRGRQKNPTERGDVAACSRDLEAQRT